MKMTKLAMDNQMLPNNLMRGTENKMYNKGQRELASAKGETSNGRAESWVKVSRSSHWGSKCAYSSHDSQHCPCSGA